VLNTLINSYDGLLKNLPQPEGECPPVWAGGLLEATASEECRVRIPLRPEKQARNTPGYRQVDNDREYSSGHPAMRAFNPYSAAE